MNTKRCLVLLMLVATAVTAALLPGVALGENAVAPGQPGNPGGAPATATVAPGAPGADSFFDLARKDCVGTARNTTSKVWFTIADGVLSDTYWPTIDATNVHTLQYLVTDGKSFTDLQTRDMTYQVQDDPTGMACTIVASNAAHGYKITTSYVTDPARDAVLMKISFSGPKQDQVYVRLDPLAGGTGGGGSQNAGGNTATIAEFDGGPVPVASNTNTVTNATNRDYAVPTFEALEASDGFQSASVGYEGTDSDGLNVLDSARRLTSFTSAPDGHVALTAQLRLSHGHSSMLALAFGTTQAQALSVAGTSVRQSFSQVDHRYEQGWQRYDSRLRRPSPRLGRAADREYYESVNVVKASEDKTFPGAIAAGLGSPWGQSVPADTFVNGEPQYFGSYRESFARDTYEEFTGLLVAGDVATAQAATKFLFDRQQQPDGSMPRNSLTNGKPAPDTGGVQLDETAYPILMAWQSGLARDATLYTRHVIPAADFLVAHGPSDGVERWEEQTGYSPSTIAAEIAGLTAAAHIAIVNHDHARARVYQATADDFARNIKAWTVTDNGPYISPSVPSYFIRVAKAADPDSGDQVSLGNGSITVDQRSLIDAGFLDLVRLGVLPASDPVVQSSLTVVDSTILTATPSGPGYYRYGTSDPGSEDGYGDCFVADPTSCSLTGAPWAPTDTGSGHPWPALDGERAEYDIANNARASAQTLLTTMSNMTSGQGLEPEQVWEDPAVPASPFGSDPTTASIGFTPGQPDGSASPLGWAQAQYARLTLDLGAGRDLETPQIVSDRYVRAGMPGTVPLTVTSPASGTSVDDSDVTVTGISAPGARIDAEADGSAGSTATIASVTADSSGNWTLSVPSSFGSTTITVAATLGGSTAYSQVSVTDVALPGTTVLSVTDPAGDDNGPGTYAYPTDTTDFQPGAFDLTGMQVSETDTDVYIQVSLRNLDPTFGGQFGAQLLDVYVRNPAAQSFSTGAAFPSRNYTIAPADAWSERLEAQGFAPVVWDDVSGTSLGSGQFVADQASKTATIVVPRTAFGDVGSGWVFTVTLTGQDGFSADQARAFTQTPQDFSFGVCQAGNTSPICTLDPNTVPKVMDTITPDGVTQSTELDPTLGPVALSGVAVP